MAHLLPMSPQLVMDSLRTSPARHLTSGLAALATVASIELPANLACAETEAPTPLDSPAPSRTLTLPEAVSYAHAHQPAIRAALSRVRERIEQARIPSGRWLPT